MPDIVDGLAAPLRGELGQWIGHSLVGILLCVPPGLLLTWLARRFVPARFIARLDQGSSGAPIVRRAALSVAIGALSHVIFDLVTHANFLLFLPWSDGRGVFPEWWSHAWTTIPLLVYREPYPIAPHTIVWGVLSVVGAVLFFRCVRYPSSSSSEIV
jgi:LexA-binding, inner membrane-associated putative hydrolase